MRAALIIPMLLAATTAVAQESALQNLAACRGDAANAVNLSFAYTGGACEQVDEATVAVEGTSAKVSVPTRSTAEVCTMQAVQIDVAQTIAVAPEVTTLDVELLNPQGNVSANGSVKIEAQCTQV